MTYLAYTVATLVSLAFVLMPLLNWRNLVIEQKYYDAAIAFMGFPVRVIIAGLLWLGLIIYL